MTDERHPNARLVAGEQFYGTDAEGLSITHEQMHDAYTAGTSDGLILRDQRRIWDLNRDDAPANDTLGPEA